METKNTFFVIEITSGVRPFNFVGWKDIDWWSISSINCAKRFDTFDSANSALNELPEKLNRSFKITECEEIIKIKD